MLPPFLKGVYKILKKTRENIWVLFQYLGPYEKTRRYRGFTLVYTRGYSLVGRLSGNNIYEPELSQRIIMEIKRTKSTYFIDVGANIGLISLNVLNETPEINIFCFEPGPEQCAMLRKTIRINKLDEKIRLYQYSMGDQEGEARFAVHKSVHTSGDGFFDTKRAGKCKIINVAVDTLDNWWKSVNCPTVKVVKIDTEGAELWVLKGGSEFIKRCRPVLILEINRDNIKPYPYNERDVLKWLNGMRYGVKKLDGTLITEDNLGYYLKETDSYIASPDEY